MGFFTHPVQTWRKWREKGRREREEWKEVRET